MSKGILKFLGRSSGFGDSNNSAYYEKDNELMLFDCGLTVFNLLKEHFNLAKYEKINVIITHLHPDHAASLGWLIMYLGYQLKKKTNVISKCKKIKEYLNIMGVDPSLYTLIIPPNVTFIETEHVPQIDAYGVKVCIDDKVIVYTGDTATFKPFKKHIINANELYVDVSKDGKMHLKIDDILEELLRIQKKGTKVYLMHLDDEEYISRIVRGRLEFAQK